MTTLLVTGTSGHLGRLVVEELLARGVAPGDVVATARDTASVADLAERGVTVRHADYDDPASLATAFASSSTVGQRVPQHADVVEAAAAQGVSTILYTSVVNAGTSSLLLAEDHVATERLLEESGLATVLLRNCSYLENWTGQLAGTLERGVLVGAARDGRVSAATRADYAAAAAVVLADETLTEGTFELGGDTAFTLAELAADVAAASGREVVYQDLPQDAYADLLEQTGLPRGYAEILADSDRGIAAGDLRTESGELSRLVGRPTTTPLDAVRAALAGALATR